MVKKKIENLKHWLLRALQLQLFITTISVPLLILWGLPLSLLTIVGNLLFNPVLALFLFLASLIFFTELLHIPNGLMCSTLEYVSQTWLSLIAIDTHPWLMGLAQVSWWTPIALLFATFGILHYKKITMVIHKTALFLGVLIVFCLYITFITRIQAPRYQELTCNHGHVTLLCADNKLALIDPGVIGQRINCASWIEYTLVPHLQCTTGKTSIEYVIALQPNALTFQALTTLLQKIKVSTLYCTIGEGNPSWRWFAAWEILQKTARDKNTILVELSNLPHNIILAQNCTLTLSPCATFFKRENLRLPVYCVKGNEGTEVFTIYPYAYEKKLIQHTHQDAKPINAEIN